MLQRQTPYLHGTVFVYELVPCGIDGMEQHLEDKIGAEDLQGSLDEDFQLLRSVDVELRGSSEQAHGADEPWQSHAMVAMCVGNKDVSDAVHSQASLCKASLTSFPAVYHIELASCAQHLAGGSVALRGVGTATAEDI